MPTYTFSYPANTEATTMYGIPALNISSREYITKISIPNPTTVKFRNAGNSSFRICADWVTSGGSIHDAYLSNAIDIEYDRSSVSVSGSNTYLTNSSSSSFTDCTLYLLFKGNNSASIFTLDEAITFTIETAQRIVSITSVTSPIGAGTTINVDGDYLINTSRSISATANNGYLFNSWGATAGSFSNEFVSATTYTASTTDATVTAYFELKEFAFETAVVPSGAGTISGASGYHEAFSSMSITATPSTGYVFEKWSATAGSFADYLASSTTYTASYESGTITAYFKKISTPPKAGYYNGTSFTQVVPMYYNGTDWVECEAKRYNGSSWVNVDTQ